MTERPWAAPDPVEDYWYGDSVVGSNQGGIVFYRVHGQQYTIDDTGPTPPQPESRTVYYDPANPYVAMLDSPLRWGEEALFVGLVAGSVASFGTGVATGELHRRRRSGWAAWESSPGRDRLGSGRARQTGCAPEKPAAPRPTRCETDRVSWLDEHIHVDRPRWKQLLLDDGALPWALVALGLVVLWVLLFLAEIQSPNWLYWSGDTVQGTNRGGIVFYRVAGQEYTIDDPAPAPARPTPQTVWYKPGNPDQALLDRPARLVEAGVFVGIAGAAVVTLGVGVGRGELYRRRKQPPPA